MFPYCVIPAQVDRATSSPWSPGELWLTSWAPAGIFPGGGGKPLGGPQKICEGGPHIFFRQALKYAYRGGGGSFDARRVFSRGPQIC